MSLQGGFRWRRLKKTFGFDMYVLLLTERRWFASNTSLPLLMAEAALGYFDVKLTRSLSFDCDLNV